MRIAIDLEETHSREQRTMIMGCISTPAHNRIEKEKSIGLGFVFDRAHESLRFHINVELEGYYYENSN